MTPGSQYAREVAQLFVASRKTDDHERMPGSTSGGGGGRGGGSSFSSPQQPPGPHADARASPPTTAAAAAAAAQERLAPSALTRGDRVAIRLHHLNQFREQAVETPVVRLGILQACEAQSPRDSMH